MRLTNATSLTQTRRLLVLVSILLLAYILRLAGLESESLWIDEGYSLALADHGLVDITRGTAADQHPPLYYFILHYWLLPGKPIFYSRYLSVIFGVLGVAAAILIGKAVAGWKAGLTSGFLLACSPVHIWYSQEIRMYILLGLLTTLSCYLTWRIVQAGQGWIPYVLISLSALYTHYFAGFVLLAESTFVLSWSLMHRRKHPLARWIGAQAVMAGLYAPWLPIAIRQAHTHRMTWIHSPTAKDLHATLSWLLLGDSGIHWSGIVLSGGLSLMALAIVLAFLKSRTYAAYGFLVLWFGVPFATIVGISQVYPIFHSKQLLILVPPLIVLFSGALTELRPSRRLIIAGVVVCIVLGSLGKMYLSTTKHGWREAARYIEKTYEQGDLLYLNPAAGQLTLEAYLTPMPPHAGYPPGYDVVEGGWEGELVTAGIAKQIMDPLASKYQRIWLVEFGASFWDPQAHLVSWLKDHGHIERDKAFRGVRVRLFELGTREQHSAE
jgi:uncharacterized membrane protein